MNDRRGFTARRLFLIVTVQKEVYEVSIDTAAKPARKTGLMTRLRVLKSNN